LCEAWAAHSNEEWPYSQVHNTLLTYNRDTRYASRVLEVMEIIAKRSDRRFEVIYNGLYEQRQNPRTIAEAVIEARRQRLADLQSALSSAKYRHRNRKIRQPVDRTRQ
jgi:hypothetical protein